MTSTSQEQTVPPIKHQIHSVLLTRDKRQGVALGNDDAGRAIRIYLLTPRAVEQGMEKLRTVARACGGPYTAPAVHKRTLERERALQLSHSQARTWSLR